MKRPSATAASDGDRDGPRAVRLRSRAAPRSRRARRRRARRAAPRDGERRRPLAGRDRERERHDRAAGDDRRDDAHRPERERLVERGEPGPAADARRARRARTSGRRARRRATASATSSATKPAACEITVDRDRRQPPREQPAGEVGDAPRRRRGEREQDGEGAHAREFARRSFAARPAIPSPAVEPLRIGVLAVQGNFREHAAMLRRLGADVGRGAQARAARRPRRPRHPRRRVDDVHAPDAPVRPRRGGARASRAPSSGRARG